MSERRTVQWTVTPETLRELAEDMEQGGEPTVWPDADHSIDLMHPPMPKAEVELSEVYFIRDKWTGKWWGSDPQGNVGWVDMIGMAHPHSRLLAGAADVQAGQEWVKFVEVPF